VADDVRIRRHPTPLDEALTGIADLAERLVPGAIGHRSRHCSA